MTEREEMVARAFGKGKNTGNGSILDPHMEANGARYQAVFDSEHKENTRRSTRREKSSTRRQRDERQVSGVWERAGRGTVLRRGAQVEHTEGQDKGSGQKAAPSSTQRTTSHKQQVREEQQERS